MSKTITVQQFFERFPDDKTCLDHLMQTRYGTKMICPKCGREGKFSRLNKIPAYSCPWCGDHIHPMAGTPFEHSSTPLQKWFYAMYLFTTSRHGVPAKELQRQLGVTYKTAWRMGHEIRKYMAIIDGDDGLSGNIESDETYIGGRAYGGKRGRGAANKTIIFGMLQRDGDVIIRIVPNVRRKTLEPIIEANVAQGSVVNTDELPSYAKLFRRGYNHTTVNHGTGEYVCGSAHVNNIEGFWSQLKRSIKGTHIHVSKKHMSKYLGEFEFRYNMRKEQKLMFSRLLLSF